MLDDGKSSNGIAAFADARPGYRRPLRSFQDMLHLLTFFLAAHSTHSAEGSRHPHVMDHANYDYFAVELQNWEQLQPQNCHDQASELATELGMVNMGQIGHVRGHYLFEAAKPENIIGRRRAAGASSSGNLSNHPKVRYQARQVPKRRLFKRNAYEPDVLDFVWKSRLSINDPGAQKQWHWYNRESSQRGNDLNITGVWLQGVTGKNVTVAIIDDGLDYLSPDLKGNFFREGSWDFNGGKNGSQGQLPTPVLSDDRHGTRCAGEIAAMKNDVCGVGAAWDAKVAGDITEADEAAAITFGYQQNQIYSCSWGPADDGAAAEGPPDIVAKAFEEGIRNGRGGLGSIYVFASGNGGGFKDNCNYDGYTNSIWTITIGAIDRENEHPTYAESCTALMAVTYSSSGHGGSYIFTTDVGEQGVCTEGHGGTSAAAPIASGILALVLSVRPDLSWRDVQRLVLETAVPFKSDDESWTRTAARRPYSVKFGYGKLDAYAIVERARTWTNIGPQTMFKPPTQTVGKEIPDDGTKLETMIAITAKALKEAQLIFVEHITVTVNIDHSRRGELNILLTSPSGIVSELGSPRPYDVSTDGLRNWTFSSVKHWDEDAVGLWTLSVIDTVHGEKDPKESHKGSLLDWTLTIWGEGSSSSTKPSITSTTSLATPTTLPSPTTTSTPSVEPAPPSKGLAPGAIFGIVLLVGVLLVGGVLAFRWFRRRREHSDLYQFQELGTADPDIDGAFFSDDFANDFGTKGTDLDDFLDEDDDEDTALR
ncbi:hypothetical protein M427DRAFT_41691 [Gonapodya prolifera JEL478]|uniref:P/Homo B domain-containing protein n=1 Tax=Gonapodya prolifera (strain JEL478) TaxID=1344416 RepID=A0A139ATH1_GONPJ|nr:hypothetical protein M427DRAFT_41691 [Gonapodya prolifera JEL478]|eukprot:KXS19863.1 hypothetical protein M427DRAFT_41691 [Gonapodya prolifera JEL478]